MNIHEYQAKQLFNEYGIPVPKGKPITSIEDIPHILQDLGGKTWVVKAQVHAGGRGKAGGVKLVESQESAISASQDLLGKRLITLQTGDEGLPINQVLIEQTYNIAQELYLSLLVDRSYERLVFIASASGGMDIETVAEHSPDKIHKIIINPLTGLQDFQTRQLAYALGLKNPQSRMLATILQGMYRLFLDKDASQIEINPLILTTDGELLALDAKINFDDNALPLHAEIDAWRDSQQEDPRENIAQQFGLNYISLHGNIGCMVNGAGLAMATMDLIKLKGGQPANFLDVGGGTTVTKVAEAFKLILSDPNVKAVLVNIFGGIVKCDVIAEGILAAIKEIQVSVPVVVRLEGTNVEQGRELLANTGLNLYPATDLASAAEQVVALAEQKA